MQALEAILADIITLLTGGLVGMGTGLGKGLGALVTNIFLETNETGEVTGMSLFAGIVCIFGGIGLTVGLSRKVVAWISSLGGSRM